MSASLTCQSPTEETLASWCRNSAFGLVFASATDVVSHLMGAHWRLLGRELFKVLAVLLFMRNILLSCYELTVDTIAGYPLLNPTMLARLRNISLDSPRSVVYLLAIMHAYFGMAMFVFSGEHVVSHSRHPPTILPLLRCLYDSSIRGSSFTAWLCAGVGPN